MKFLICFALLSVLAVNADAFFDLSHNWSALRVSWYVNPLSSWGFDKMPRDLADNTAFEKKDDMCATGNGKFFGQRYWYKQDPTVILLYDKNGIIAGIQTSFPKTKYTPPAHLKDKYYIDDGDFWTLTAYFVEPSTICTEGRSKADLSTQGTGTGLWLQYGQDPIKDSFHVPNTEAEMKEKNPNWGHGRCFWTMGKHYWYNVSQTMDCDDFVPNCILYNGGKLTAFCFATGANLIESSNRFDSPAPANKVLDKFFDSTPDCFFKNPNYFLVSTMHVYFIDSPRLTAHC